MQTPNDVERWRQQMVTNVLEQGPKEGAIALVDLSDVDVAASIAEVYGKVAKRLMDDFGIAAFRYGRAKGLTQPVIQLQAVIQNFSTGIYDDREAALRAVEAYRATKVEADHEGGA